MGSWRYNPAPPGGRACTPVAQDIVQSISGPFPRSLCRAFSFEPRNQESTLYFLNQPIIWFQASSAASLR